MKIKDLPGFLVLLALFIAFVWYMDVRVFRAFVLQYETGHFLSGQGEIVSGEIRQWTGSRGTVRYHPSFTYRYHVRGRFYLGRRYRYDGHPSFYNEESAREIVEAHPAGSSVDVFYDPENPADAVLSRGLDTADLAIPFVFGSITLLASSFFTKFNYWQKDTRPAGGVRILDDRMAIRVRLPRYRANDMCLLTLFFSSFIAGVIFENVQMKYPPIALGLFTFACISIASAMVYVFVRRRNESGLQDVVIDALAQKIELPLTFKRREKMQFNFNDVSAVTVEPLAGRRRSGPNSLYTVNLQLRNGPGQTLTALRREKAEAFAIWLREKLGLRVDQAAA